MKGDLKWIFFSFTLLFASFIGGFYLSNFKSISDSLSKTTVFAAPRSTQPELQFFVMSFCPFGNQIEDAIRPVYDLLGTEAKFTPHYIFDKIDNLSDYCRNRFGDESLCQQYVQNKYFPDLVTCRSTISKASSKCLDEKSYLKSTSGALYSSLHGRQEGNQNVRELCAWNLLGDDKKPWWNFIDLVNKNCTADNADICWEQQGKQAGLDTTKITECFNKDAFKIIDKEIEISSLYKVKGSPTVLINETDFPPTDGYSQEGNGSLTIGKKIYTQDKYRTPNTIKEALCTGFSKTPLGCKTILKDLDQVAPVAGGCID
jgi:hypothetical protein